RRRHHAFRLSPNGEAPILVITCDVVTCFGYSSAGQWSLLERWFDQIRVRHRLLPYVAALSVASFSCNTRATTIAFGKFPVMFIQALPESCETNTPASFPT